MKPDRLLRKLFDRDDDPLPCADVRFPEKGGSFDYRDAFTDEIVKIRSLQLVDTSLWKLLVDQFRLGNVDDPGATWKGEYWGKMMRGACFVCQTFPAADPDNVLYAALEGAVRDLLSTEDSLGRIATYSVGKEFTGWDLWCRKYVMLGLLYFLDISKSEELSTEILAAVCREADYIMAKVGHGEGKREIVTCTGAWDGLNSCSILEPFVLLFNATKDPKYLEYAEYIASFGGTAHENYFKLMLEDETPLASLKQPKAYEMISCFDGLAELSKINGDEDAREAVIRFGDRMLREEMTVIGSLGADSEILNHSSLMQSDGDFKPTLDFKGEIYSTMQETCVTVTWMKFVWQLWRMTGDVKYMDAFEFSMVNAMSSALKDNLDPTENGGIPLPVYSYAPIRDTERSKLVGGQQPIRDGSLYGCCVCISSAGFALDTLSSVAHDNDGKVYVNLYRNGTVTVSGLSFTVTTDYPLSGKITLTVDQADGERTLALRVPLWAEEAELTHNGDTDTVKAGYAEVSVHEGDTLVLELPMNVRFLTPDDASDVPTGRDDHRAVLRGPVVFALDHIGDAPTLPLDEKAETVFTGAGEEPVLHRAALTLTTTNGGNVTLVDYRSAGQTDNHRVSAWIKIR